MSKELKYYVCLFKLKEHETYRIVSMRSVEECEKYLKTQLGKNIVTSKKFFEIDRLTGKFEEF